MAKRRARRTKGTGSVRLLASGKWQARVLHDGRRISAPEPFDTKQDARAWLARANRDLERGTFTPPVKVVKAATASTTLADYSAKWLAQRELRPRTRLEYQGMLTRHVLPVLGDLRLDDLTPAMIRAWYAECCPDRARTRSLTYSLLKSIIATAVEDEILPVTPCKVRAGSTSGKEVTGDLPTVEQLAVLTDAMPARLRALVPLAAWCGLRAGELAGLQRGDLDLPAGLLHVRRAAVTLPGLGRVLAETKTAGSVRTVAVPPHAVDDLARHLAEHVLKRADSLLFPSAGDTKRPVAEGEVRTYWAKARQAAGLPGLRLHDLRHFAGTLYAQSGATLAETMARLGHTSTKTAMRYQHATADRDRQLADKLSERATTPPLRIVK